MLPKRVTVQLQHIRALTVGEIMPIVCFCHSGAAAMALQYVFHGPLGRTDFLGLRKNMRGHLEIVYDDGGSRTIWRVEDDGTPADAAAARVSEALRAAMDRDRVIPALHSELLARAIRVETLSGG